MKAKYGWWLLIPAMAIVLVIAKSNPVAKETSLSGAAGNGANVVLPSARERVAPTGKALIVDNSIFGRNENLRALESAIRTAEDTLDEKEKPMRFARTEFDNRENYGAARDLVREPYPESPTGDELRRRMAAIHFLGLTRHLEFDECRLTLEKVIERHDALPDREKKRAIRWDILSLAKICTRKDATGMVAFQKQIRDSEVASEVSIALEAEGTKTSNKGGSS